MDVTIDHSAKKVNAIWPRRAATIQFQLIHLVYAVTLLSVSLAAFGPHGVFWAFAAIAFWGILFNSRDWREAVPVATTCTVMLLVGGATFVAASKRGSIPLQHICKNHLREVGIALERYEKANGSLPPAFVANDRGVPVHSWRVLLLPYLGYEDLYEQYDFDEPWNGPNNRKLATKMPIEYSCPAAVRSGKYSRFSTPYVVPVGPGTAWPGTETRRISDFENRMSTTLILEAPQFTTDWMAPCDPSVEEAVESLGSTENVAYPLHGSESLVFKTPCANNIVLGTGWVDHLSIGTTRKSCHGLFSIDSHEDEQQDGRHAKARHLMVGKCVRLGLFAILIVMPLPLGWLKRRGS